jgi:hypothetical protein
VKEAVAPAAEQAAAAVATATAAATTSAVVAVAEAAAGASAADGKVPALGQVVEGAADQAVQVSHLFCMLARLVGAAACASDADRCPQYSWWWKEQQTKQCR